MKKIFERRGIKSEPLLAHSYERVMPGRHYVASIRDFWRVCSGVNKAARKRVAQFLSEVLNIKKFPLTVLERPIESETAKIIENSYRATILAFMDEWSLFAERNGVDLKKVIEAIKVCPTRMWNTGGNWRPSTPTLSSRTACHASSIGRKPSETCGSRRTCGRQ